MAPPTSVPAPVEAITLRRAATELGLSREYTHRLIRAGELPAQRDRKGNWALDPRAVADYKLLRDARRKARIAEREDYQARKQSERNTILFDGEGILSRDRRIEQKLDELAEMVRKQQEATEDPQARELRELAETLERERLDAEKEASRRAADSSARRIELLVSAVAGAAVVALANPTVREKLKSFFEPSGGGGTENIAGFSDEFLNSLEAELREVQANRKKESQDA